MKKDENYVIIDDELKYIYQKNTNSDETENKENNENIWKTFK